jgi:hypothetical protein
VIAKIAYFGSKKAGLSLDFLENLNDFKEFFSFEKAFYRSRKIYLSSINVKTLAET